MIHIGLNSIETINLRKNNCVNILLLNKNGWQIFVTINILRTYMYIEKKPKKTLAIFQNVDKDDGC